MKILQSTLTDGRTLVARGREGGRAVERGGEKDKFPGPKPIRAPKKN